MASDNSLVVQAQMLIRKSVAEVFEAFINPSITTKFWFTHSTGRLETGKKVQWLWEMFDVETTVNVKAVEINRRIEIEWDDPACSVEWEFESYPDGTTLVKISNWGFSGSEESTVAQAIDSKGGFTMVLSALKALLEHNVQLNLVADQFPQGCPEEPIA